MLQSMPFSLKRQAAQKTMTLSEKVRGKEESLPFCKEQDNGCAFIVVACRLLCLRQKGLAAAVGSAAG